MKTIIVVLVAMFATGCDESACIRQSDCPQGQHCNANLSCESDGVDGATMMAEDGGTDAAVVVADLVSEPIPCTDALFCYIYASDSSRIKCIEKLSPAEQKKVKDEFLCVAGGFDDQGIQRAAACPQACMRQLGNVEVADPDSCWKCAKTKLGGICALECN